MKSLLYIFIFLTLFVVTSCDKDFIELTPPSEPTVDILYTTDDDFNGAVVGVYDDMQAVYTTYWQFAELRADNADHLWTGYEDIQKVDQFRMENSDAILNDTWANYYQVINNANLVLDRLSANTETIANRDQYEGEAQFLRALAYFNMVRIWGEVPLVLTPISASEALQEAQSDEATLYAQIIQDFTDAAAKLPAPGTAEVGRATSGAAKALLGKVYLTTDNYAEAESVLSEIIDLYELLPNYNDVFDADNEHHAEYIFDIEYAENLGGEGSNFTNQFIPNSAELQSLYSIIGTPGETSSPTDEFVDLFSDEDQRSFITWTASPFVTETGDTIETNHSFTKKYLTSQPANNDSRMNWKVTRYADVVLMYAEALNENGKTDQAIAQLNRIRSRAGVPEYDELTQEQFRDAVALERRLELAFEGHRWFDLLRTERAVPVMQSKGYLMEPHQVLFAKPQQQIDVINDPSILSQNPGY